MHRVSKAYKLAMDNYIREQGYIQIGLGAISLEAQGSAKAKKDQNDFAYWSNSQTLFSEYETPTEYATLEQNMMRADSQLAFMPEQNDLYNLLNNVGVCTRYLLGAIKIEFADKYPIKGLTIDFGDYYPTSFKVINDEGTEFTYTNNQNIFVCTDVIGDTKYIIIHALTMRRGQARLRIKHILMGVGLTFGNTDVKTSTYKEFISPISEEVSSQDFDVTILDPNNKFNVDSSESFINFLEIGQDVNVSMGMTLADGNTEWLPVCSLKLKSWGSTRGEFKFKAEDYFASTNDKYTLGNKIYTRTAYEEAESILQDMGYDSDEYIIDYYLDSITLTNPMPECTHKEALQILANACRCVVYQDYNGIIRIVGNFAIVIEPEDIEVDAFGTEAEWSMPSNTLIGTDFMYADMTQNFVKADGNVYFLPEDDTPYLDTAYVSSEVANSIGEFTNNPKISYKLEAGYTFYGFELLFGGNPPKEMTMTTYYNDEVVQTEIFTDIDNSNYIYYEFDRFDYIEFEFTKGAPNNRVILNKFSLGDYNDYYLKNKDMLKNALYGTQEKVIKQIAVKIYSYTQNGEDAPVEVEDDVWYTKVLDTIGNCIEVENPLIHTQAQAEELSEWLAAYYMNNIVYDVDYRGDPRLNCADIIHIESDALNNLQVAIINHTLKFNGAWSGDLSMRRALKLNI